MDYGYIKLHRKIQYKGYYKKPNHLALWIHLLLNANHKETELIWNGKIQKLKAGQLITGRTKLSKNTGISGTTIERILKMLENGQQIGQQKTNKYRIITIKNWDKYQNNNEKRTAKRTSNGHLTDTNKNDKNDNKKKSSFLKRKKRPFYLGDEMRYAQNKWWVIQNNIWKEYNDKESNITWK